MVGGNVRIKENDWYYTGKKRNEMEKNLLGYNSFTFLGENLFVRQTPKHQRSNKCDLETEKFVSTFFSLDIYYRWRERWETIDEWRRSDKLAETAASHICLEFVTLFFCLFRSLPPHSFFFKRNKKASHFYKYIFDRWVVLPWLLCRSNSISVGVVMCSIARLLRHVPYTLSYAIVTW